MFLDHTQRRTTFGKTPLDEWSARRRYLYLPTVLRLCVWSRNIKKRCSMYIYDISSLRFNDLTLILLTWRKWTPNNASKWQMGFNSAIKVLRRIMKQSYCLIAVLYTLEVLDSNPDRKFICLCSIYLYCGRMAYVYLFTGLTTCFDSFNWVIIRSTRCLIRVPVLQLLFCNVHFSL
jgi:hypothetical protein